MYNDFYIALIIGWSVLFLFWSIIILFIYFRQPPNSRLSRKIIIDQNNNKINQPKIKAI